MADTLAARAGRLGLTLEVIGLGRSFALVDAQNRRVFTALTLDVIEDFLREEEARRGKKEKS